MKAVPTVKKVALKLSMREISTENLNHWLITQKWKRAHTNAAPKTDNRNFQLYKGFDVTRASS